MYFPFNLDSSAKYVIEIKIIIHPRTLFRFKTSLKITTPLITLVTGSNKENIAADVEPIIETPIWKETIPTIDANSEHIIIII